MNNLHMTFPIFGLFFSVQFCVLLKGELGIGIVQRRYQSSAI